MGDDATQDIPCSIEGCKNQAARGGYCWGHLKRRQRNMPVDVELRASKTSPKDRFMDAVFTAFEINSSDDDGWRRLWHRLRMAATRYVKAEKQPNRYGTERCPHKE